MKAAHTKAKAFVAEKGGPSRTVVYKTIFAIFLSREWQSAKEVVAPVKAKLEVLTFEHQRRNLSSAQYFGSNEYRNTEARIADLKTQLAA